MQTIAHYNLLEKIGDGGVGEVFRARDTKVGRTVALKVVAPPIVEDRERLERLMSDAQAASVLSHPNIATLFDVGEADGRAYLAYEFAAGRPLADEMRGTAMNPRRALDLAIQIADGVADAHAHGILHGDLRPGTIFVTDKGSAKVLDFGMAPWTRGGVVRAGAARHPDTLPVYAPTIVAYLSPEQAIGGAVDARTDVFTMGTLAYEMITGTNPFAAGTPAETIVNVIQGRFASPSEVSPAAPPELDVTLGRALTRDLEQRQQSAAAFAAELRSVAAMLDVRSGDAAEPSALLPIDDSPDRTAAGLLTGALLTAAAAAGFVWWWLTR
ncbi:MAG: serine/threonine-protein kinase [Vicinamibacterales bacterium]